MEDIMERLQVVAATEQPGSFSFEIPNDNLASEGFTKGQILVCVRATPDKIKEGALVIAYLREGTPDAPRVCVRRRPYIRKLDTRDGMRVLAHRFGWGPPVECGLYPIEIHYIVREVLG